MPSDALHALVQIDELVDLAQRNRPDAPDGRALLARVETEVRTDLDQAVGNRVDEVGQCLGGRRTPGACR